MALWSCFIQDFGVCLWELLPTYPREHLLKNRPGSQVNIHTKLMLKLIVEYLDKENSPTKL